MTISLHQFLELFGDDGGLSSISLGKINDSIKQFDFDFAYLPEGEHNELFKNILHQVESKAFDTSGVARQKKWDLGWKENLEEFKSSDSTRSALIPKYYRISNISRLRSSFIKTRSGSFQYDFFQVLLLYVVERYLGNINSLHEFGCGPGHNIVAINGFIGRSQVQYHGYDWARSAVDLVDQIRTDLGVNCQGHLFDFFNPNSSINFKTASAVMTVGALEQIGDNHLAFTEFLLEKKPSICVNIEPLKELYNPDCPMDQLAIKYHESRGYLDGYLPSLQAMEKKGLLSIDTVVRVPFGGVYHEGWSYVVWRPSSQG